MIRTARPAVFRRSARRTLGCAAAALLLAAAFPAAAQRTRSVVPELDDNGRRGEIARIAEKRAEERFDRIDTDKDDRLSPQELAATAPYMAENFKAYDKNSDGFLSWHEFVGHDRWERAGRK